MQVLEIPAKQCEHFKQLMQDSRWEITHQDAGQTHLVGWGYEIHWSLDDRKAILRYNDKQGVASAFLEFSDSATNQINSILKQLNAGSDDS
jgi:hypothetical protein